jgi:prepilin-type processing-associated H-X9-DG protein
MFALGDAWLLDTWVNGWKGGEFVYFVVGSGITGNLLFKMSPTELVQHGKSLNMLMVDGHVEHTGLPTFSALIQNFEGVGILMISRD